MRRSATAFKGFLRANAQSRRNANFKQIPSAASASASSSAASASMRTCSLTLKDNIIFQSQCKLFSTEADARAQVRDEQLQDPEGNNVLEEVQPVRMRLRDVSISISICYTLSDNLQFANIISIQHSAGCSIASSYGSIFAFLTSFFSPIIPIMYCITTHNDMIKVPISEVLKAKHTLRWVEPVIPKDATVRESIQTCIENGLSGMMVIDTNVSPESGKTLERGKVVGMITSRDLLRIINAGFKDEESDSNIFERKLGDYMTPITQVIYARPEETIGMCRSIMAKLGVKCLPILSHGRVEGLVTARDMSNYGLDAAERGGKKLFLESVCERVGLSSNTSMAEPPAYLRAHLALQQNPLFMNIGMWELPHPFKTAAGCGGSRRGEWEFITGLMRLDWMLSFIL